MSRVFLLFAFVALLGCWSDGVRGAAKTESPPPGVPAPASASFLRADDARVAAVAYRLASAGAAHCPAPYPLTGLSFHHLREYQPADRPGLVARYGLNRGLGVLGVVEGSPAALAGLEAGDVILQVNGEPIRPAPPPGAPEPSAEWRAGLEAGEDQLEAALGSGPASLTVLRGGRDVLGLSLASRPGCPARVRLARSGQNSAFATARHVILTSATLAFAQNDDELAVILGHELAHVILGHADRLKREGVPKGLLRGLGKNAARVRATEEEADRLGLRLAWAAGYDVTAAIPFWRRYYARFDTPQFFRTHPSLGARERLVRETLAELQLGAQRPKLGKGALPKR